MTEDQPARPDSEREERQDSEREEGQRSEREEGADSDREQGADSERAQRLEGEKGFGEQAREFPRALRDDTRQVYRDADKRLAQTIEEKPALEQGLNIRILLAALVIAFVLGLILRFLLGVGPGFSIVVF